MTEPCAWRPAISVAQLTALATLRRRLRQYFETHTVLEVQTAAIATHTVTEPAIESLSIHVAGREKPLYLQTSPEYQMKRLLAAGAPDIYQLGPVFRDAECGRRHQFEFTLVEWYRHGFDYEAIIADTIALIRHALNRSLGVTTLRYADTFRTICGIDIFTASQSELCACVPELNNAADLPRDALLDLLMTTRIVETFATDALTVLTHYPASQAALAQLDLSDPRTALRFEVFFGNLELANGFVELADEDEQAARFAADRDQRHRDGKPLPDIDPNLLAALAHGLPSCAGVAMGVERLAMVATDVSNINAVVPFPI